MNISTVKAKCKTCGNKFETPLLSDFAYGEFIYCSQDGQVYMYFYGLENKTWEFVDTIVTQNIKLIQGDQATAIQNVIGHIADKDGSTKYYQNKKIICSICGQDSKIVNKYNVIGCIEINEMSFDRFERQTTQQKINEIKFLLGA